MGHIPGRGLGKTLQGISAPVEAQKRSGKGFNMYISLFITLFLHLIVIYIANNIVFYLVSDYNYLGKYLNKYFIKFYKYNFIYYVAIVTILHL